MFRKDILLIFAFFLFVCHVDAQTSSRWKRYRYELVGGLGATTFLGELGGANRSGSNFARDFEISMTRPAISLGLGYRISERVSVKLSLNYGILRGDDKTTKQEQRQNRNLNFFSHIVELTGQFEYAFIKDKLRHKYSLKSSMQDLSAYVFIGYSGVWFNPYGKHKDTGKWVALQPLGTEGQGLDPAREKYNRFTMAIPYGLGIKYRLNREWSIGLEFGIRKTFTDYLDDVSTTYYDFSQADPNEIDPQVIDFADPSLGLIEGQTAPNQERGDATDYDSYSFLTITLIHKVKANRNGFPKFVRRSW